MIGSERLLGAAELSSCSPAALARLLRAGHPIAAAALADSEYRGTSLGLPRFADRLLWKRFRKAFRRDPASGALVGWNVRTEQDVACTPRRRADGEVMTFGHFAVVEAPAGTPGLGAHGLLLDYGKAGSALDPLRALRDPLVAVHPGSVELLLGRTYLALGPLTLPTPSYFILERDHLPGA